MKIPEIDDEVVIDKILSEMYNNGDYKTVHFKDFLTANKCYTNEIDMHLLRDKIEKTLYATPVVSEAQGYRGYLALTRDGIELLKNFESYKVYNELKWESWQKDHERKEKEQRREKWKRRFEFILTHANTSSTILLSLVTAALTTISIFDRQERRTIERENILLITERDSLKLELNKMQKPIDMLRIKQSPIH